LQPGQSAAIKFTIPGQWQMHCHPHPWMRGNITVVENYANAPAQVDVNIIDDGAHPNEFRYSPENVTIGVGTVVLFHNIGTQPHTATSLAQDPPVSKLPIEGASGGSITLATPGWQQIRAYYRDAKGHSGQSLYNVYVGALPVFQKDPIKIDFPADANGAVPPLLQSPITNSVVTSYNGTMFLNFSVSDAGAPAESAGGQNLAQVAVHLKAMGEEKDLLVKSCASSSKGELFARTLVGTYTIEIDPCGGVQTSGSLTIEDVYDLDPPAPIPYSSASAGHHH
jgi:plastocyanin